MPRSRLALTAAYAVLAASIAASSLTSTAGSGGLPKLHLDSRLLPLALLVAAALVVPLFAEGFKELFKQALKRRRRGPWWLLPLAVLLQLTLIVSPLILLIGLAGRIAPRQPEAPESPLQQPDSTGAQQPDQGGEPGESGEAGGSYPSEEASEALPSSSWPLGAVVGVLLTLLAVVVAYAAVSAWIESRSPQPTEEQMDAGELELLEATQEAIREVEEGGDPRGAVVSYFLKLCRLLRERGVPVSEEMTAREVARAALRHFERLEPAPLERLVRLFEEARYSDHYIDEGMRRVALTCFTAIRDSLAGGTVEG
ncbi:MAG: DUF4129 domain-containing protein [Thermofilaceae archaeon]